MARGKAAQTHVPGIGFIFQPVYIDKKTKQAKHSAVWWMAYETNDGQIRKSTKQRDQTAAFNELVRVAADRVSGKIQESAPERVTFGELFRLVVQDYFDRKQASLPQVKIKIDKHLDPIFGGIRVTSLKKSDVDGFKRSMVKKGKSAATVNRCLSVLRRSLQLGADADPPLVTRAIPKWFGKLDEDNVRTGIVSEEQYRAVMPHMVPHVQTAFCIGYHLGMRLGEILALEWSQVDWENHDGAVIHLKRKQTKAKKARTAPIYGDMPAILQMAQATRPEGCQFVVQESGRRVQSIKTAYAAAWDRAELLVDTGRLRKDGEPLLKPPVLFHDLRRTAATNMDDAGISRERIKDCVGWETDAMFTRYRIGSTKAAVQTGQQMQAWMDRRKAEKAETLTRKM